MSGPHARDSRTIEWLERLWETAEPFELDLLMAEIEAIERDDEHVQALTGRKFHWCADHGSQFQTIDGSDG